jgi:hypothetical protein
MGRPRQKVGGKWVFVPDRERDPKEVREEQENQVATMLAIGSSLGSGRHPFAAFDQFRDYFPDDNAVPEGGSWILVKKPPLNIEYTVPPLSLWFAEPWLMEGNGHMKPFRVKVMTPRGELGLFPHEYTLIDEVEKFYEFFGQGMTVNFFGGDTAGVPEPALFYLRSRGIDKADAIKLLIGSVKAPGVLWVETDRDIAKAFVHDHEWPDEDRLATRPVKEKARKRRLRRQKPL